jgi:Flp pilus assembly protein CpaB
MKRANVLVAVGAVLVFVGIGLAFVVSGNDDEKKETQVAVVVAKADISPGESGEDLVAAGKVGLEQVAESKVVPGAVRGTSELQGKLVNVAVAEGDQLSTSALRDAVLRGESIAIPKGMQAVAVTVPFTDGVAGYAGPGDLVNVYVTIPPGTSGAAVAPFTRLMLSNVLVLDVSTEVAPRRSETVTADSSASTARTEADNLTLLLALDAEDAERVIFSAAITQLSFTLVPEGQKESETEGVTFGTEYVDGAPGSSAAAPPPTGGTPE